MRPARRGGRARVKAQLAARSTPPEPDTRRRVVLIEDDPDIAEAMTFQLEKAGLQLRVARTGEEGLEAVRRGADLVLLDLNLPGMDGLEACRMIRRQQTTAHVPIIMVTARADEVDRVLGLEMGADDYVVKPFSLKELAARCKVALRRAAGAGERWMPRTVSSRLVVARLLRREASSRCVFSTALCICCLAAF